jgi:hypothetical protein
MKELIITITDDEIASMKIVNNGFSPTEQIGWAYVILNDRLDNFKKYYTVREFKYPPKPRKNVKANKT